MIVIEYKYRKLDIQLLLINYQNQLYSQIVQLSLEFLLVIRTN